MTLRERHMRRHDAANALLVTRLRCIARRFTRATVAGVSLVVGSVACAALVVVSMPAPAHAHHSASMFDQQRTHDVTAEVKEFQWTNPHVWIQIYVEDDDGAKVEWSIEGGGRNSLARNGWRPTTFEPGDIVHIRFNPMRDGSPAGLFIGAKLPDGSTIGRWETE